VFITEYRAYTETSSNFIELISALRT